MVVLRLKRMGRAHRPFYRLGAMDKRSPRDGRVIEQLGWYDPVAKTDQIKFDAERVKYWLSVGAIPSETAASLIRKSGVEVPVRSADASRKRSKAQAQANPKPKPAPKAAKA
jgi:small subunit ribosomal protein S16